ncbi:hypothetical protein F2Q70_00010072 [Brassica cretica]|uniref:Secreted protein n=1 Tax=Brassica cretica TaxID=69181 RepID=A0A8S9MBM7_BRACR|nr:hypothetical protein F2Q70_00010072 [Brassica cretica]
MVMFRAAVMFLWFVTVMHAPVVAGETRPCSDVGSPGGGDDAGSYLEVGRIARCRWMGLLGNGLGPNLFGYFFWALCLGLRMVVRYNHTIELAIATTITSPTT